MKSFIPICLCALMVIFTNCEKEMAPSIGLSPTDLIGYWEANSPPPSQAIQFMLGGHYCNSVELRMNNEFAIYYFEGGKPEATRVDGSWSIMDQDTILFNFTGGITIKVKVTELSDTTLTIQEEGQSSTILLNQN